jgi:hypothetical protein
VHIHPINTWRAGWAAVRAVTELGVARGHVEVQRYGRGDYTLLHDGDPTRAMEVLEAQLCITMETGDWPTAHGGAVTYLAGADELLTIQPTGISAQSPGPATRQSLTVLLFLGAGNALSLVFRDPETMGFVKYINHHAGDRAFVRYLALYTE